MTLHYVIQKMVHVILSYPPRYFIFQPVPRIITVQQQILQPRNDEYYNIAGDWYADDLDPGD